MDFAGAAGATTRAMHKACTRDKLPSVMDKVFLREGVGVDAAALATQRWECITWLERGRIKGGRGKGKEDFL